MGSQPGFDTSLATRNGVTAVSLRGELDMYTSPLLVESLAKVEENILLLDLGDLRFLDCAGLHALCESRERAGLSGGSVVFVGASPRTTRLFELTNNLSLLEDPRTAAMLASFIAAPSLTGDVRDATTG